MTAVAVAPARPARFRPARALRLEIKHSPVVWALPILAVLFYFNAYRPAAGLPPTWTLRAWPITGANLAFFSVFAAGLAAWVATREDRRKTGDLLATTARAAWARQATVLAATAFWMVFAYLAGVAVIYIQTARQATWGGPLLWPVAVGVVGTATACAVGFTCGTLLPSRFIAPIVAVAAFVLWYIGVAATNALQNTNVVQNASNGMKGTSALLVAYQDRPQDVEAGVFYHISPDVSIAQVMFMGGILLVTLGLLALSPAARVPGVRGLSFAATGRRVVAAAALVACGVAASATAFSLTGTARFSGTTGWGIPALHDAAGDQPVPYTPDCTGSAFQVCIHPALDAYLDAMSASLQPAAAEIAGLPGAPVRAELAVGGAGPAVAGTTSVYDYSGTGGVDESSFMDTPAEASTAAWEQGIQQEFLSWFVSGQQQTGLGISDPAQQAVANALLAKIGAPALQFGPPQGSGAAQASSGATGSESQASSGASGSQPVASAAQISAAASSFESLSSAARHAWLAANIAALRSGTITLTQLP